MNKKYKYIDNNITFENIIVPADGGIKLKAAPLKRSGVYTYNSDSDTITTIDDFLVEAVDINWNEANVEEGVKLTTTGDLLSWIKSKLGLSGKVVDESLSSTSTNPVQNKVIYEALSKTLSNESEPLKGISNLKAPGTELDNNTIVWDKTSGKWKYVPLTGVTLNLPLSGINTSGLSAPEAALNKLTIVWNNNNRKWEYSPIGGEVAVSSIKIGSDGSLINPTSGVVTLPKYLLVGRQLTIGDVTVDIPNSGGQGVDTLSNLKDVDVTTNLKEGQGLFYTKVGTGYKWKNVDIGVKFEAKDQESVTTTSDSFTILGYKGSTYDLATIASYATNGNNAAISLTNYYTKEDCDNKFLTISFFNKLFEAYNDSTKINPNNTAPNINNIKALHDFWSVGNISACGKDSSSSENISLNNFLSSLNSSSLVTPGNSQKDLTIVWNGSAWEYRSLGGSEGVTLEGPLKDINNIAAPTSDQRNVAIVWDGEKWIYQSISGSNPQSFSFNDLTSHPDNLSGYGIKDALNTGVKFWGRTVSNNVVSGNMSDVGTISASGNITVTKTNTEDTSVSVTNSNGAIYLLTSENRGLYSDNDWVVGYNGTNTFLNKGNVGIGTTSPAYKLDVNGTMRIIGAEACDITTARNNDSAITTNAPYSLSAIRHALSFKWYNSDWQIGNMRSGGEESAGFAITEGSDKLAFRVYNGGTTYGYITQAYGGIRIGDGLLMWDSTNNALKVLKSDGTAANLYATGGVSALGMSAGTSAVDAMKFGYLTVNTQLKLPTTIIAGNSPIIERTAFDSDCLYLFNDYTNSKINSQKYYYNQYDNVGLLGKDYNYSDTTWWIDPDGCAKFRRLYFGDSQYIYVSSNGVLYYRNGNITKQIAFTN